ncbi:MAG: NTP transferase domain-containing protein [Candidatus Tectimicrobiota bacterium]
MPRIVASIEARMGSSRLPGKVLADVCGQPALSRLLRRLQRCTMLHDIVLATSVAPADDALEAWARHEGIAVYRGSEEDVLARVVEAQRAMDSDLVVEITGDCILLDPEIIDWGVSMFLSNTCDVVTNARQPSFPMGVDVQVYPLQALADVACRVHDPAVREHVSLYFYEHPERYRILHLCAPARWYAPQCRLQLDYAADLQVITALYQRLEPVYGEAFGLETILATLCRDPALAALNQHCQEKAPR